MSRLLDLARRQPWLRERVGRAVDRVVAASSVAPPGLRPGGWARHRGRATDDTAVVVVDATGLDGPTLRALVDALPQMGAPVRFVLAVDGPQLAVGRRAGVVVEHIIDAAAWAHRHDPAGWPAYRHERFEQLRRTYHPHLVVPLPSGDPQVLARWVDHRPRASRWRRVLIRAERTIDPPPRG